MSLPIEQTRESIEEDIKQRMESDEKLKAWFHQFNKDTWASFIGMYAITKYAALQCPNRYANEFKPTNKVFNEHARTALEHIQQKKLFNLQCEWRAGKLELPIVQFTYDFQIYGRDAIMDCPFLPPVEMEEVELFIQFLKSSESNAYLEYECEDWQAYHTFKTEHQSEESCETPDWYEFYDSMRGTGYLLDLPDLKGEQEDRYRAAIKEHERPDEPPYVPDPEYDKPYADEMEFGIDFAKRFEDPETAEIIVSYIKGMDLHERHGLLEDHFDYLKKIPETFPFVQHQDWREALRLTALQYQKDRIADALPRVWRQYIRGVGDDREAYINRRIALAEKDLSKLDSYKLRYIYVRLYQKGQKLLGEE